VPTGLGAGNKPVAITMGAIASNTVLLPLSSGNSSGNLIPQNCQQEPTRRSVDSSTPTSITFINSTPSVRRVYWLDYSGNRVLYNTLSAGKAFTQGTRSETRRQEVASELFRQYLGLVQVSFAIAEADADLERVWRKDPLAQMDMLRSDAAINDAFVRMNATYRDTKTGKP
jgi:hypothetical protein